jgi:hypothetical protein
MQVAPPPPEALRCTRVTGWRYASGAVIAVLATAAIVVGINTGALKSATQADVPIAPGELRAAGPMARTRGTLGPAYDYTAARWQGDIAAMQAFRPGYSFWQHIFEIPDGAIAYGSAIDGRLLAVFPAKGDWTREGAWTDVALANPLAGRKLPLNLSQRRDEVAEILEQLVGPVVHNPTRGQFLAPGARRFGAFLEQWGAIYERFGVPAEIGLAQALIESGLDGQRRSRAGAVGFCQWLARNWKTLDRLAADVIEAQNQTTQAPYCAAYLTVLATKHGAFIPALSAHHSGGTNVARTLINGERLGAAGARERYFLGAQFARDLRLIDVRTYKDLYGTYGPRSYRYAEMTFGNSLTIARLMAATPQVKVHAMRTSRSLALSEIIRRTRLSEDEVRRFNPALVKAVPAGATLYLPLYVSEFGGDVSFWQRPANAGYVEVLNDFVRLDAKGEQWDDPSFAAVLREFERRFQATRTEEGSVMATVIAYAIQEMYTSGRGEMMRAFRSSQQIQRLFERGVRDRDAVRTASTGGTRD